MPSSRQDRSFLARTWHQLLADTLYVLVAFPVTLAAYIVCFTLFMLGVGLVIIWVGLPIMVAAHKVAGGFAGFERGRTSWVIHSSGAISGPEHEGSGLLAPLTNARSWVRLIWTFIAWIPATVAFGVVVSWWASAFGAITYPAWRWALPDDEDNKAFSELMGLGDDLWVEIVVYVVGGVILLILLPLVVRVCALMQAWLTRGMLGPPGARAVRSTTGATPSPLPPPPAPDGTPPPPPAAI